MEIIPGKICSTGVRALASGRNPFTRELLNERRRVSLSYARVSHRTPGRNVLGKEIRRESRRPGPSSLVFPTTLVSASTEFLSLRRGDLALVFRKANPNAPVRDRSNRGVARGEGGGVRVKEKIRLGERRRCILPKGLPPLPGATGRSQSPVSRI